MFIQNMYGLYSCKKENRFKVMRLIDTTEQTLINNEQQHTLNTQKQTKKAWRNCERNGKLNDTEAFHGKIFLVFF